MKVRTIIACHMVMILVLFAAIFTGIGISVVYDVYNPRQIEITSEFEIQKHYNAWTGEWVVDKEIYFTPSLNLRVCEDQIIQKVDKHGTPVISIETIMTTSEIETMSYWDTFKPENRALRDAYWEKISNDVEYYFMLSIQWIPWLPLITLIVGLSFVIDYLIRKEIV